MNTETKVSILNGPKVNILNEHELIAINLIFEKTVDAIETISRNKNNNEIKLLHSIIIRESEAQNTAVIHGDSRLTYIELNEASNKLARVILKKLSYYSSIDHKDKDVIIAVCMKPSILLIITLLAIWKAGAAYLPLDVEFPIIRIKNILNESRPLMTIVDNLGLGDEFRVIKYSDLKEESLMFPGHNIPKDETLTRNIPKSELMAAVLYTSGSTGAPKGVRIPHLAILNRLSWQFETFPYGATEKICAFKTALTFVDSICELWGPLLNARTILIIPKEITKNPEKLTEVLEANKVERLVLVPTLLQSILMYGSMKKSEDFLKNLRLWVCSGEVLPVALAKKFFDCFDEKTHRLCNFYGSTEVMGDVTYHILQSKDSLDGAQTIPLGKPINNCNVYVLDQFMRPTMKNEIGELYVSGLNLARGYVGGREEDRFVENFVEKPNKEHEKLYRTGDFARIDNNVVYYEGRKDCQIKIRGHRVDLSEIESALEKISQVDKYVVLTYNPGEIDQALLTYVTIKDKVEMTAAEIEDILKSKLAHYMIPKVKIVPHIPLLVNGKVDRQHFLQCYKVEIESERKKFQMQEDENIDYSDLPEEFLLRRKAEVLFPIILQVLGENLRGFISGNSNFYSLGGNSLNSIYTVTKLLDAGYSISITDFITSETLLDVLNKMKEVNANECLNSSKDERFTRQPLTEKYKNEVFELIASSFYEKADLERVLKDPVKYDDYIEMLEVMWPHLIEKNLSFVVLDSQDTIVGAVLNFDVFDEPEVQINPNNKLNIIFAFLEYLEGPIRETKLPKGTNKVLHNFMMGSKTNLSPQETIKVFCFMEEEVLKFAKSRNFEAIFTSNTNELTQQLAIDINNYDALLVCQVNQYVAEDGTKPFERALDSQKTIVSFKKL